MNACVCVYQVIKHVIIIVPSKQIDDLLPFKVIKKGDMPRNQEHE